MEEKIAVLTERIIKEGVEKGEEEKNLIIKAAKEEAARIKNEAAKNADVIIADAKKQAEEYKKNVESEVKLSSTQAISSLKQQITDLLLAKTVDENVSPLFSDADFLKKIIAEVVSNWKFGREEKQHFEIIFSESQKETLYKSLERSLKDIMKNGVTISFSRNIKGGFQIGTSGASYKISLTNEDFIEFFKEFLKPRTRSFLFEE